MGARYLIVAHGGGPADRLQGAKRLLEPAGWRRALAGPGFALWTPAARPAPVERLGATLVVAGDVWRRPGRACVAAPDTFAELLADWHGAYVAARPLAGGRGIEILRGPSGAMDLLAWRASGLACAADDLRGVPSALWPDETAIDWDVVCGFFRDPVSVWGACALTGVRAVAPGEVLAVKGGAFAARTAWRPADFVAGSNDGAAPEDLVDVVTDSVAACAAAHERLLLEVSGGLDSAIVATSLAAAGQAWRAALAVNQFAAHPESDERALAKEVCAAAGVPLACRRKPVGRFAAADFMALADGARPAPHATDLVRDRMLAGMAARCGATAILTGQGGDAVFFQMPTARIVADLVLARGPAAAFGEEAQAAARWLRRSVWSLARQPLRLRPADLADAAFHPWLGARARDARAGPSHPWLKDLAEAPPGKQVQIQALCAAQMKFGRTLRSESLAVRHPLLAQPVVELCLEIPSWRLTGGRDRGFARAAFAQRLPPRIAQRRSKGVLSILYAKRMVHSLEVVRPWLLDGVLCEAEVLDRAALEASLTPEALLWEGQASRLAWAAALEGWLRHWQGRVPDAPGAERWRRRRG